MGRSPLDALRVGLAKDAVREETNLLHSDLVDLVPMGLPLAGSTLGLTFDVGCSLLHGLAGQMGPLRYRPCRAAGVAEVLVLSYTSVMMQRPKEACVVGHPC